MNDIQVISLAIDYIEQNLQKKITVFDVARFVSYSYIHFQRIFYNVVGETVGSYIRGRRLTQSSNDLLYSKQKITDISLSRGFETPESFSRAFKKRFLLTPSTYRNDGKTLLIGHKVALKIASPLWQPPALPQILSFAPKELVGMTFNNITIQTGYTSAYQQFHHFLLKPLYRKPYYGVFIQENHCSRESFTLANPTKLFIGFEKTLAEKISMQKTFLTLKGGTYAKFIHRGPTMYLPLTYHYIWGTWLVNTDFSFDQRADFEYYSDRFTGENQPDSEIHIYFPIQ